MQGCSRCYIVPKAYACKDGFTDHSGAYVLDGLVVNTDSSSACLYFSHLCSISSASSRPLLFVCNPCSSMPSDPLPWAHVVKAPSNQDAQTMTLAYLSAADHHHHHLRITSFPQSPSHPYFFFTGRLATRTILVPVSAPALRGAPLAFFLEIGLGLRSGFCSLFELFQDLSPDLAFTAAISPPLECDPQELTCR